MATNEAFNLNRFVNRDSEMNFIREQCVASLRGNRPINPQFIQFNGVWGIGKTTMLKRIEHYFSIEDLHPVWTDISESSDRLFDEIAGQIRIRYDISYKFVGDALDEMLAAIEALSSKYGKAVVFIDSLDAAGEEDLKRIEAMLHRITETSTLLCIMASRKKIDFKSTASIGRRLRFFPLKPFSQGSYVSYVGKLTQELQQELKEEEINQIFPLTGGYPAAVDIAVKTIKQEKLDLTKEQDRGQLVQIINEQVIEHGVLSAIRQDPDQLLWHQTMLSLFAIPRRFNLTIMRKMIEKFAPQYMLSRSLAYMSLQQRINFTTGLLDWNEARTGYAMEAPVRHLLLMKWRVEDRERYTKIHDFLMEENWRLAMQFSGTDRVRHIQEYLYHSAFCLDNKKLQENVDRAMKQIVGGTEDSLPQFEVEYKKDEELQDALGSLKNRALTTIYKFFADSYWDLVSTARDKQERVSYLVSYVFYSINDPAAVVADRLLIARRCVQQVKAEEDADVYRSFLEALSQDPRIKELLGDDSQTWNLE